MKTIKYEFADGRIEDIEVSDEVADVYEKYLEYEKVTERRETRKRFSLERLRELGIDFEDPKANVEEILIKEENEKREPELRKKSNRFLRREKRELELKLTQKQAEAYFQFYYLKRKKVDIADRMEISEGAVRKLIFKAENNLEKILHKESATDTSSVEQHKIKRDTFRLRLIKELWEE